MTTALLLVGLAAATIGGFCVWAAATTVHWRLVGVGVMFGAFVALARVLW